MADVAFTVNGEKLSAPALEEREFSGGRP